MNTSLGYAKKTLTDSNVLLSGGGDKALSEFIGSLNWDSTNKKLQYKSASGTNFTDLITFGSNAFTSYSGYNIAFLNNAGTTVDTFKALTSPSKTFKAGTNVQMTAASNVITITATDTTYSTVSKTAAGLCPTLPNETTTTKYLRLDGAWAVPPDNNTWKPANTSLEGYAPKLTTGGGTIGTQSTEYVLTFKSGTDSAPVWRLLPVNAYNDHTYTVNNATYSIKSLVGSTTTTLSDFTANQSGNDDFTLVQGSNITFTVDATNRKLTIAGTANTWNAANASQAGYVPKSTANKILRADGNGALYWGDDANTTYTFYNLQFQNSGGTTVDTYKPTTSPTKTLKAGSNVTISASSNVITIASTDTNTWRGMLNNLTTSSSSTNDSLSAYLGYLLANGSARDSTKLPLAGGTMTGSITMSQGASARNVGIIGTYDYTKAAAIWTMGASYQIPAAGNNLGSLYGAAYVYQGLAGLGVMAGGHQFVWAENGVAKVSLGNAGVWTTGGFKKNGSSDSYVLLGGGGHKAVSDFATSGHNHNSSYVASVSISGNNLRINKNGTNTDLTIPYATSAGSAANVTGVVAIANGGTGASTRLNALKALTNDNVSTDAQYFLTITLSWGKGGYTSVADAKTVLAMTGATSSANGTAGVVPAPPKDGYNTKFLRADGTWLEPSSGAAISLTDNNDNAVRPILLKDGTGTGTVTSGTLFADGVTVNPSTNSLSVSGNLSVGGEIINKVAKATEENTVVVSGSSLALEHSNQATFRTALKASRSYIGSTIGWHNWQNVISCRHRNGTSDGNAYGMYIRTSLTDANDNLYWDREEYGSWQGERTIIDSGNIGSQSVASASTLTTARNIWGQSFNGSGDVNGDISVTGTYNFVVNIQKGSSDYARLHITNVLADIDYVELHCSNLDNSRTDRPIVLQNGYGNVGIGTTSPSYKLHVNGNVGATNFYTISDRTKKQNIFSFSEHIRKFQLKDTEKWHYGVIAQEVPEMFKDGEEGNMTVNYNSVLSYYVGCLENRVKELEEKIKLLETKQQ